VGEGALRPQPTASCAGPEDTIFCTDDRKHTVRRFTPDGTVLLDLVGTEGYASDTGYRGGPGTLRADRVITRGRGRLRNGVALSPTAEIYISDGYGTRRSIASPHMGSTGRPGECRAPVRPSSGCRTTSGCTSRVGLGADRRTAGSRSSARREVHHLQWTDLIRPTDVFIDNAGVVYVTELCMRVSLFTWRELLCAGETWTIPPRVRSSWPRHTITCTGDSRADLYNSEVSMTHPRWIGGPRLQKFRART